MSVVIGHSGSIVVASFETLSNPFSALAFVPGLHQEELRRPARRRGSERDTVIEDVARREQVHVVSDVLRRSTYNDQPYQQSYGLDRQMARRHGELPDRVDRDRLERGCAVVVEHGRRCASLATASLVYCYAGYPGVKVLDFSRRLGHDADRRVGETASSSWR